MKFKASRFVIGGLVDVVITPRFLTEPPCSIHEAQLGFWMSDFIDAMESQSIVEDRVKGLLLAAVVSQVRAIEVPQSIVFAVVGVVVLGAIVELHVLKAHEAFVGEFDGVDPFFKGGELSDEFLGDQGAFVVGYGQLLLVIFSIG